MAEQWTAEDPEFARAFRVVYPDGFTLDGAQFPSGRCVVDDRSVGLVEAATDIDSLGVRRPGDRIEWADAAVEWSVRFADGTVMSQIFTEEGARAHAALYTAAVDDPAEPVWRRAGPWQPASSGEQSDRTDWRREAELLDRTLTQAARRFVEVVTEREELRAELARVRARVREAEERAFQAGLAKANNAITWNTTCVGCADQLDTAVGERAAGYAEGVRDGRAQAAAEIAEAIRTEHAGDWPIVFKQGLHHAAWIADRLATADGWETLRGQISGLAAAPSGTSGNPREHTDA